MNILVKGNMIYAIAENITFGIYDEPFEKWRIADEEDNTLYYMIDDDFTLIENVSIPSDYEDEKYFYENGEFILNEDWAPYVSPEERITILEEENARLTSENLDSIEIEAELMYELSLMQLGLEE